MEAGLSSASCQKREPSVGSTPYRFMFPFP